MKRKEYLSVTRLMTLAGKMKDPRRQTYGNKRHELVDILVIALLGIVCGCETWKEIWDYGCQKKEWLKTILQLPHGIPSVSTIRRVFERLKPEALEEVYRQWVKPYIGTCVGKQICIDGKTICGVARHGENTLHMVSAWVREDGITLGQIHTEEKSNEITAIPQLIEQLDIRGGTITTDAMGCQRAIAERIIENGGQYVLAVKQNQPTLYEEIDEYFKWARTDSVERHHVSQCSAKNFEHGKTVHWHVTATEDTVWFESKKEWAGLRSFVMVERVAETNHGVHREQALYISSLEARAESFQHLARGHWSIENQLHWMLDCNFHEDDCLIHKGNAPQNLSLLRKMALALLKRDTSSNASIRRKQKIAGWNNDFALLVVS